MPLMDWKSDSTAESLVMLRPRTWLLLTRLTKVETAFCSAFRNCAWLSSDSPFWYCRARGGGWSLPGAPPHPRPKGLRPAPALGAVLGGTGTGCVAAELVGACPSPTR